MTLRTDERIRRNAGEPTRYEQGGKGDYTETVEKLDEVIAWVGGAALSGRGGKNMPHQIKRRRCLEKLRELRSEFEEAGMQFLNHRLRVVEVEALLTAQADELATLRRELAQLQAAVREWKDATAEADEGATGWTQRVRDAEIRLRSLVPTDAGEGEK